jgi:tryptophan halogenase
MPKKIENIVVVGGGSAGWMTAATLINFFPNKNITVIESPDVPIVGVGESTLGGIRSWMHALGIDEKEFMKYTNASYKMSIKFTDFYNKDAGSFHYPFGQPMVNDSPDGLNEWQNKKSLYPDTPVEDYCRTFFPAMPLIENNKFNKNTNGEFDIFRPELDVAYHFEATLFGRWLREEYCIPRGVVHIADTVSDISTSDKGIEKLILSCGQTIIADLFVDCSGWKSMLLGEKLDEPFTSFADILPNNKAWAVQLPYVDPEKELEPYTNCTAIGHGWCWNIPLWSRLGTGYVYSDKFISPEDAKEEFKEYLMSNKMTIPRTKDQVDSLTFKDISMRIGIHERTWVKNVVAIGLSAGFIEPLESNGLFSVHEFLFKLVATLDREYVTQWDLDVYNTATLEMFNNLAEFVALHYTLSVRDDTNYWDAISKKTFSPGMVKRVPTLTKGFNDLANRKMFNFSHTLPGGIHCIATGMNYFVKGRLNLMHEEHVFRADVKLNVDSFVSRRALLQQKWISAATNSPSLFQYLKDNIYNE